jgi:hypothetical protein
MRIFRCGCMHDFSGKSSQSSILLTRRGIHDRNFRSNTLLILANIYKQWRQSRPLNGLAICVLDAPTQRVYQLHLLDRFTAGLEKPRRTNQISGSRDPAELLREITFLIDVRLALIRPFRTTRGYLDRHPFCLPRQAVRRPHG